MRKRLIYGSFLLTAAILSGVIYHNMRNDAGQSDPHTVPAGLSPVPSSPGNVREAVQNGESRISVEHSPEHLENQKIEPKPQTHSDATAQDPQDPTPLKGKTVTLEDGRKVIIIEDVPDSWKTETEVRFDKEGKAHISHSK